MSVNSPILFRQLLISIFRLNQISWWNRLKGDRLDRLVQKYWKTEFITQKYILEKYHTHLYELGSTKCNNQANQWFVCRCVCSSVCE